MKNIFWVTVIGFMGFVPFIGEGSVSALTPKSTLPSTVRSEKELRMIQEAKEALREFFTEKQISAANANELVWWRIHGANLVNDKELLSKRLEALAKDFGLTREMLVEKYGGKILGYLPIFGLQSAKEDYSLEDRLKERREKFTEVGFSPEETDQLFFLHLSILGASPKRIQYTLEFLRSPPGTGKEFHFSSQEIKQIIEKVGMHRIFIRSPYAQIISPEGKVEKVSLREARQRLIASANLKIIKHPTFRQHLHAIALKARLENPDWTPTVEDYIKGLKTRISTLLNRIGKLREEKFRREFTREENLIRSL